MSIDESTEEGKIEAVNRLKLANALLLTSQGIAFLHAGQERGRTKPAFTTAGTSDCETIGNFVKIVTILLIISIILFGIFQT
jgi:pullulanase/glycogen debranching enzyme